MHRKNPIRVYDYCQSYYAENNVYDFSAEATETEIDHVTLQTVLKLLDEKFKIKINTELIKDAIAYVKTFEQTQDEYDPILIDYDPSLQYTKEEQEKLIKNGKKYQYYKGRLKELDFIADEKETK